MVTVDPQVVILGGGLPRSSDLLLSYRRHELQRLCLRAPEIRSAPTRSPSAR
ncbi:hypothetical protein [Catellatospora sichuanensis]|uniref:hypothetical protein n=1 Tax=Catellatospora sichuanensis TaxID=1969805 RepID=UPI001642CC28|nr:hypothetical protein [Catellatospora sichuanensis]